jgi:hypothetical protein
MLNARQIEGRHWRELAGVVDDPVTLEALREQHRQEWLDWYRDRKREARRLGTL